MIEKIRYLPGSIVGVQGGFLANLQHCFFQPATHLWHFLIIRSRLEEEDDYEVFEMLGSGAAIGRLSWYDSRYYVVYEPTDPAFQTNGKRAAKYASKYGRRDYDFGLFIRMPADLIRCWFLQLKNEHRIRRIYPDELKLAANKKFVCTELPVAIYCEVGIDPLAAGDAAIPPAYVKAEQTDSLRVVDIHYPRVKKSPARTQNKRWKYGNRYQVGISPG